MARRPCLTDPTHPLAPEGKSRCVGCESELQRERNASRPQYRGTWPTESRQRIAEHRAIHGDRCPGWEHPPHDIHPDDWACDHDVGPLCIRCNGRKGGGHDRQRAAARRATIN